MQMISFLMPAFILTNYSQQRMSGFMTSQQRMKGREEGSAAGGEGGGERSKLRGEGCDSSRSRRHQRLD